MNDKEAFEKWMKDEDRHDGVFGNNNNFTRDEWISDKAWQAACAYKQEEITLLENQISWLEEQMDDFMDEPDIVIKKLQAEKVELQGQLKSCIFVYEEKVNRLIVENQVLSVNVVLLENKVRQYQSTILELQERTLMLGKPENK